MKTERVLVFPTELLYKIGPFQGFTGDYEKYIKEIFKPGVSSFLERNQAENDPRFKQIIPYVIFTKQDKVLVYYRGKESDESRLVDKASIGIGGHIKINDDSIFRTVDHLSIFHEALNREINEELNIDGEISPQIIGLINDDSNDVGRVHLGIVCKISITSQSIEKRERQICKPQFININKVGAESINLESWSSICLEYLKNNLTF